VVSTRWCYSPHGCDYAVCFRSGSFLISLDLTAPDFFLWGYLKSKVYSTRPTDLHTLKENVREAITKRLEETLQAIMHSFLTRVHLCIEEGGGHLKDIVHKK